MNRAAKAYIYFLLVVFLAACGGAAVTNNVIGGEAKASEQRTGNDQRYDPRAGIDDAIAAHGYVNNGGAFGNEQRGKTQSAAASGFDGYWAGPFDGGAGEAIIARGAGGRYGVQLSVAGRDGCAGQLQGQATVQGGRLVLVDRIPDGGGICRVTMTRRGATLTVEEDNCAYHHGMSCGFSGTLRFRESNDGLEPPPDHSE